MAAEAAFGPAAIMADAQSAGSRHAPTSIALFLSKLSTLPVDATAAEVREAGDASRMAATARACDYLLAEYRGKPGVSNDLLAEAIAFMSAWVRSRVNVAVEQEVAAPKSAAQRMEAAKAAVMAVAQRVGDEHVPKAIAAYRAAVSALPAVTTASQLRAAGEAAGMAAVAPACDYLVAAFYREPGVSNGLLAEALAAMSAVVRNRVDAAVNDDIAARQLAPM